MSHQDHPLFFEHINCTLALNQTLSELKSADIEDRGDLIRVSIQEALKQGDVFFKRAAWYLGAFCSLLNIVLLAISSIISSRLLL